MFATIIVLIIVVAIIGFAIRSIKKHGSGCSSCPSSCPSSSTCKAKKH